MNELQWLPILETWQCFAYYFFVRSGTFSFLYSSHGSRGLNSNSKVITTHNWDLTYTNLFLDNIQYPNSYQIVRRGKQVLVVVIFMTTIHLSNARKFTIPTFPIVVAGYESTLVVSYLLMSWNRTTWMNGKNYTSVLSIVEQIQGRREGKGCVAV